MEVRYRSCIEGKGWKCYRFLYGVREGLGLGNKVGGLLFLGVDGGRSFGKGDWKEVVKEGNYI